jgi:hypothetical protein
VEEFLNKELRDFFLKKKKINHVTTCISTPQHNTMAERKIDTFCKQPEH